MAATERQSIHQSKMRQRAEERLRQTAPDAASRSFTDTKALVHELHVHQLELEMQNQELRAAQLELEASRDWYVDLFDFSPVGYVTLDAQGLISEANLTAATLLEVERGRLIGQPLSRLLVAEDQDVLYFHRQQLLASAVPQTCEVRLRRQDAGILFAQLRSSVVRDPGGQSGSCRIALWDITARKRAEADLRASEERFRATFEQAAVGIAHVAPDGPFIRLNHKFCEIVGYTREEMLRRTFQEITYPDDLEVDPQYVRQLVERQIDTYSRERRYIRKDGSCVWVNLTRSVVRDGRDQPQYFIDVVTDISDRKQAEAALATRTQQLESLADNAPDLIFRLDRAGRCMFVNGRVLELGGLSRADCLGRTVRELGAPPEVCAVLQQDSSKVLTTGRPEQSECTIRSRSGSRRFDLRLVPEFAADGTVEMVLGLARDVTEHYQLQEELGRAQKMEVLGQLAAGVAHDLNNLLTTVSCYATLMRAELPDGHPAISLVERVEEASQKAGGVTRALLTFSHKTPTDMRPVRLGDVVSRAARLLQGVLPAAIELLFEPCEDTPLWVTGDAPQLEQVVLNLAINARDAMPNGGQLRIAVARHESVDARTGARGPTHSTGQRPVPPGWAAMTVSDTGTGIQPEVLPRVFEPFFTTKPLGRGTGLGLTIVQNVIKSHAGHIAVESEPGRGTTFSVFLPCIEPGAAPESEDARLETACGHGATVLVAEDNPQVLEVLTGGLEQARFRVIRATDAQQVLLEYARHQSQIRVLLLDIDLPKGNGLHSLQKIRRVAPTLPAIIITGRIDGDFEAQLDEHSRLLRKPLRLTAVISLAARLLEQPTSVEHKP